jgi:hypothetical protein
VGQRSLGTLEHAGFLEQTAKARKFAGRGIQRLKELSPTVGIQSKAGSISQRFLGTHHGAFEDKLAYRPPRRLGGGLQFVFGFRREPEI